jgi:hypothetical protein
MLNIFKMSLDCLPNDLLLDITELIAIPSTQVFYPPRGCKATKDLLSFMLCSKRYQLVVERVFYKRFVQQTVHSFPRFRHTLLEKPRLLQYVRQIQLRDIEQPAFNPDDTLSNIASLFQLQSPENGEEPRLIETRYSLWYEQAISLILLLPNLEKVTITRYAEDLLPFFGALTKVLKLKDPANPTVQKFQLSNLRKLVIEYNSTRYRAGFAGTEFLLAHPSLNTVEGDMLLDRNWGPSSSDVTFQLRSLRLQRSNLSSNVIRNLLSCCPLLEHLMYEHDENFNDSPFFPHQFAASIAHLESCLQSLVLYRSEKGSDAQYTLQEFTTIGSLVPFQRLKHLSITAHLLLGPQNFRGSKWYTTAKETMTLQRCLTQSLANCLPEYLESLRLKDCGSEIFANVSELLNERIPNLKKITLCFRHIGDFGNNESSWTSGGHIGGLSVASHSRAIERLEAACSDRGIMLAIEYA